MSIEILHVLNNLGDGGAEALVTDLVIENYTRQNHFSMGVLSLIKPSTGTHDTRSSLIKRKGGFSADFFSNPISQIFCIKKLVIKNNIKVIHAHNLRAVILASVVKLITNTRFVIVFTQHIDRLKRPLFHIFFLKKTIDLYVAICRKTFDDMNLQLRGANIVQVVNGIPNFKMIENRYKKINVINIATVARFNRQKAYHILLKAISEMRKKGLISKYHFWLIGDGELRQSMERLASNLMITNHVTFLGNVYEARKYFNSFDALVIASDYEGLPISALEAIQAKLPIITTDVGGMKELVKDNFNGYLVPRQDPLALAGALELLSVGSKLKELRNGARQISNKFSITNCLDEHIKIYQNINPSLCSKGGMYA